MPVYGDPPFEEILASIARSGTDRVDGQWTHPRTLTDKLSPVAIQRPRRREGTVSNLLKRNVGNLPIRVPTQDWSKVVVGEKSMVRTYSGAKDRESPVVAPGTATPRPALLYSVRHNGPGRSRRWEATPGVLLSHRQEPLGVISEEDLAREGFETLRAFKWSWKDRHRKLGWRPLDIVNVLEVRTVNPDDAEWTGDWLFTELFGEWS